MTVTRLGLQLFARAGGVLGQNLGYLVAGIEVMRIGRLTKGFDLLQLLLAEVVNVLL